LNLTEYGKENLFLKLVDKKLPNNVSSESPRQCGLLKYTDDHYNELI
jgi:hypothetical protein